VLEKRGQKGKFFRRQKFALLLKKPISSEPFRFGLVKVKQRKSEVRTIT
jgi:hypothetical protein